MEALHHQALFQDCLVCVVNLTWVFAITSNAPECIPSIDDYSGVLHDYADEEKRCKKLRFHLVPLPNITEKQFEEWIVVPIITQPTTLKPMTDEEKCYGCVKRGRYFVKLRTGGTVCLIDPSDYAENRVDYKTFNPRNCHRNESSQLFDDVSSTTAYPLASIPEPHVSSVSIVFVVLTGLTIGLLSIIGVTVFYFRNFRNFRIPRGDEEAVPLDRSQTVTGNSVFYYRREQGEGEIEMTQM